MLRIAFALALLATAWSAGFFWTWSFTVMPGLDTAAPEAAVAAMRAINAGVRTAPFAFVFFGPLPLALLAVLSRGCAVSAALRCLGPRRRRSMRRACSASPSS